MAAPRALKPSEVLKNLKTKSVAQAAQELRQAFSNMHAVREDISEQMALYRRVYIETNSSKPVMHTIGALTAFSYALAWPEEYRHKKVRKFDQHLLSCLVVANILPFTFFLWSLVASQD